MDEAFPGKVSGGHGCCNPCADLSVCAQLTLPFRSWGGHFSLLQRTVPDVRVHRRQWNGQAYQEVTPAQKI